MSITGVMETSTRNQHQFLHRRYRIVKTYYLWLCELFKIHAKPFSCNVPLFKPLLPLLIFCFRESILFWVVINNIKFLQFIISLQASLLVQCISPDTCIWHCLSPCYKGQYNWTFQSFLSCDSNVMSQQDSRQEQI